MTPAQVLAQPLVWLIRGYQLLISPLTPPSCRYYPCPARQLARHPADLSVPPVGAGRGGSRARAPYDLDLDSGELTLAAIS